MEMTTNETSQAEQPMDKLNGIPLDGSMFLCVRFLVQMQSLVTLFLTFSLSSIAIEGMSEAKWNGAVLRRCCCDGIILKWDKAGMVKCLRWRD